MLEDVHWADQATLDVLRVLGRRVDATTALVLATYRDDEVAGDHPLRVVLGELTSAPAVSRVAVPRLSLEAVRELAEPYGADASDPPAHAGERVLRHRDPRRRRRRPARNGARRGARACGAPRPAARRLLEVVAVVPARAELWLLEARGARRRSSTLDACLDSGVLRSRRRRGRVPARARPPRRRERRPAAPPPCAARGDRARALGNRRSSSRDWPTTPRRRATSRPCSSTRRGGAEGRRRHRPTARRRRSTRGRSAMRAPAPAERAALLAAYGARDAADRRSHESIEAHLEAIDLYRELGDRLREGDLWRG